VDVPIVEMLPVERVDHWLRFEHLQADWQELKNKISLDLPELNPSNHATYVEDRPAYTQETAAKVAKRFAVDFEYFGYDADSWKSVGAQVDVSNQLLEERAILT